MAMGTFPRYGLAAAWGAGAVLAALLVDPLRAWACPFCNSAVARDPVGAALSWTTLLLIAVPFLLMGSIGGWVSYAHWRAEHDTWEANAPAPQPSTVVGS